jgi:uncharacterized protein YbjT (DUF2867 family)
MKKVIIIGAGGTLAAYVTEALHKQSDVHLTLFLRNKRRITLSENKDCTFIEGDVTDYATLKRAVKGQDIVYVNLAGNLEAMGKNIVQTMKETGVKRVIEISSIGIYDVPLRSVLVPYRKLADLIENSGLDYTILRPDWFTDSIPLSLFSSALLLAI